MTTDVVAMSFCPSPLPSDLKSEETRPVWRSSYRNLVPVSMSGAMDSGVKLRNDDGEIPPLDMQFEGDMR